MSLLALKNLRQHVEDEDEDTGRPYGPEKELVEPKPKETWLECTVYFNPEHPAADGLDELEAQFLAEIAPPLSSVPLSGIEREGPSAFVTPTDARRGDSVSSMWLCARAGAMAHT